MSTESRKSKKSERVAFLCICVFLIAITWTVFGQTIHYPFVNYDDPEYVYQVPEINHGLTWHGVGWAFTHVPSPNWYPLTNISHMLEAQFYGMNAGRYHLTNVLLHTLSAILLAFVLWRSTGALWRSFFVATLFAIHPLRVESVAWVTERKDVLSGAFFMLTLGAYVAYARKETLMRYGVVLVCLACGLMSKPMLVTTPFVLLLLDYWPLRRATDFPAWRRLIVEKIPLLALSAVSCATTIFAQTVAENPLAHPSLLPRLKSAAVGAITYIRQMFWPVDLAVFYPPSHDELSIWLVLICAALIIGASLIAVLFRQTHRYVFVGWFWYLGMITPVLGIVQAGSQSHADRFTYLPQIGLYLLITWSVANVTREWTKRREILTVSAAAIIAALTWAARIQTSYWRDSESLWRHTISVTKDNAFAHASLADLLLRRGRLDEAISHCQEALKVEPRDADARNNFGLALLQKGDETEAAVQFQKTLEINPEHMNAAPNLAWILATSQNPATRDGGKAVELAQAVLQRAGHPNARVLRTLGAAYAETGRFLDAINVAEEALQLATAQGDFALAEDLQHNIDNYRLGFPLRSYVPVNTRAR